VAISPLGATLDAQAWNVFFTFRAFFIFSRTLHERKIIMSLEQRINEDMKAAMKSGDKTKLDTIRLLRAAIIEFNKSGTGATMSEDDEQTILNREAKKRREALELYRQSNRPELIEKGEQELAIIMEYLPKQLSEQEITDTISAIITELGVTEMKDAGKVMGAAMKQLRGKAEGTTVQNIVKSLLQ
jgi:uncharacterized protein YqeY